MIALDNGKLRLSLDPEHGAAIWNVSAKIKDRWQIVCAGPGDGIQTRDARESALFVMLPFANRVRDNIIEDGERQWQMTANSAEPLALHGTGWERAWHIVRHDQTSCLLQLDVAGDYPFRFRADYAIELSDACLRFDLTLTNTGAEPMPAGLGFHPYFCRMPDSELQFKAQGYWQEGANYLPVSYLSFAEDEGYAQSRLLPASWQNTCFGGWDRMARITQPGLGYDVAIAATDGLDHLMVFSSPDLDRFAVEPQSHLSGETKVTQGGLRRLAPDQSWQQGMTLTIDAI